jgi:ATP-dependent Clp protease ATP-binding subunit ClpA
MLFAQEEAQRLGTGSVGTEHFLLAILRERQSVAVKLLNRLDINPGTVRQQVFRSVPAGSEKPGHEIQLTPSARHVIELASEEAQALADDFVGTEHILLGLLRDEEGLAGGILAREFKLTHKKVREELAKFRESSHGQQVAATRHTVNLPYLYGVFPIDTSHDPHSLAEVASHIEAEIVAKAAQGWELIGCTHSPIEDVQGTLLLMKRRVDDTSGNGSAS